MEPLRLHPAKVGTVLTAKHVVPRSLGGAACTAPGWVERHTLRLAVLWFITQSSEGFGPVCAPTANVRLRPNEPWRRRARPWQRELTVPVLAEALTPTAST